GISQETYTPKQSAIDLIYEIGDATSQADAANNFFLRQNAQGLDISGLLSTGGITNLNATRPAAASQAPLPSLPLPPLPSLPTCALGIIGNCTGSGGTGGTGGTGGSGGSGGTGGSGG